jgi:Fe-S-cluster containining protein
MTDRWYEKGLRFRCTRCGHCCRGPTGYVWVTEDEIAVIAERLNESYEVVRSFYARAASRGLTLREKANGDCVFYDPSKGCKIYEQRPRQCRTWPFWESNVATPEAWQKTCGVCPGSGEGDLIPVEEITRRLEVIRL